MEVWESIFSFFLTQVLHCTLMSFTNALRQNNSASESQSVLSVPVSCGEGVTHNTWGEAGVCSWGAGERFLQSQSSLSSLTSGEREESSIVRLLLSPLVLFQGLHLNSSISADSNVTGLGFIFPKGDFFPRRKRKRVIMASFIYLFCPVLAWAFYYYYKTI